METATFSDDWDNEEITQVDRWVPVVQPAIFGSAEPNPGRWEGWSAEQIVRELRDDLNAITATETPAFNPDALLALL